MTTEAAWNQAGLHKILGVEVGPGEQEGGREKNKGAVVRPEGQMLVFSQCFVQLCLKPSLSELVLHIWNYR